MGLLEMLIGISVGILICFRIVLIFVDWFMFVIRRVFYRVRV